MGRRGKILLSSVTFCPVKLQLKYLNSQFDGIPALLCTKESKCGKLKEQG